MKVFSFALPDVRLKPIALDAVRRSKTYNDIMYADDVSVAVNGPAFRSAQSFDEAVQSLIAKAEDLGAEARFKAEDELLYVWRTPALGFPNGAYAYISEDENGVKVSFYGRALYGQIDFGVNNTFIQKWASAL